MSPQASMIERINASQTWVTDDGTDISFYVLKVVHPQLLYFIDCKVDHLNLRAILRGLLNDKDSPLKFKIKKSVLTNSSFIEVYIEVNEKNVFLNKEIFSHFFF